jgi:hypothetical protein
MIVIGGEKQETGQLSVGKLARKAGTGCSKEGCAGAIPQLTDVKKPL